MEYGTMIGEKVSIEDIKGLSDIWYSSSELKKNRKRLLSLLFFFLFSSNQGYFSAESYYEYILSF